MAFRFYNEQGFTPLFRLLDDFDTYNRQQNPNANHRHHRAVQTFQPRVDVRELEDSYELHGELPGMQKENVEIEFTDPQTMVIRGRIERSYQSGTTPAGLVQDAERSGAIAEKGEEPKKSPHKATVEDEDAAEAAAEVVKHEEPKKTNRDTAKYWVSERSIGEFSRSFSFPGHINQGAVKASFKDGILSIIVPKAKKPEAHRVAIQ
jgi:HSP20 family molecular chaperone IbpA